MLSKKDQRLLDRLKALGFESKDKQRDAPFKFTVRPFTTIGIETRPLASWFENGVFSAIQDFEFKSPITGIAIFPTIFDEEIAPTPADYVKYRKGEGSMFVGVSIEHQSWVSASDQEKLRLLCDNIKTSIGRIPKKYLIETEREKLVSTTTEVYGHLIRKLMH